VLISNRDAYLPANSVLKDLNAIAPLDLRHKRKFWREKEVEKPAAGVTVVKYISNDDYSRLMPSKEFQVLLRQPIVLLDRPYILQQQL